MVLLGFKPLARTITLAATTSPLNAAAAATPAAIPAYQTANFSDGNLISFINTDLTPRTIIPTPNHNDAPIPTLHLPPLHTHTLRIPNSWCGNFFAVNQGQPVTPGILAEVCFGTEAQLTFFDVSSIVNASDTEGVKMLMPAVARAPVQGCVSFVRSCANSYLWLGDDKNTVATSERELLCFVGNGLAGGSSALGAEPVSVVPVAASSSFPSSVGGTSTSLPVISLTVVEGGIDGSTDTDVPTPGTAVSFSTASVSVSDLASAPRFTAECTPPPASGPPLPDTPLSLSTSLPSTDINPPPLTGLLNPTSPPWDILVITEVLTVTDIRTEIFTIVAASASASTLMPISSSSAMRARSGGARKHLWRVHWRYRGRGGGMGGREGSEKG